MLHSGCHHIFVDALFLLVSSSMQISSRKTDPQQHERHPIWGNALRTTNVDQNTMRLICTYFLRNDKLDDKYSMVFGAHQESDRFMLNCVRRSEPKQSAVNDKNANSVRWQRNLIWDRWSFSSECRLDSGFYRHLEIRNCVRVDCVGSRK